MVRRSGIDALVESALCELEEEFEAEAQGKPPQTTKKVSAPVYTYRWRVFRKDFGTIGDLVKDLSTKEEKHTPDDALSRHSAVVMMAHKTLLSRGYRGGSIEVQRWVDKGWGWERDKRGPDRRGREDSGCSSALLSLPLRIDDCELYNR